MSMRLLRCLVALAMVILVPFRAVAGETGSISGVVKDSQGGVVPGAMVKISGPMLPAGRELTTGSNGTYQFQRLLPGVYKVETSMSGLGTAVRDVRISVDVDAQVNFVLSPAASEEVTVSAEAPAVDLKNTELNFNYTSEAIRDLPLSRSYAGLFQLMPGIADNRSFAPAAGGSRQDNQFYIDGVNITNPAFGTLSSEINELDIAEFNMKRGAITAEFGRAPGFVANAVTKSGTNTISGSARVEYQAKGLVGDPDDKLFGDVPFEFLAPAISLGGPVIKNKLFWYASARYGRSTTPDRVNRNNEPLPDRISTSKEVYGKLTATPSQKHLMSASFRNRPGDVQGSVGIGSRASVATVDDNSSRIATAAWSFFPTSTSTLDLKFLYSKENGESTPVTDLGYLGNFNHLDPARSGEYTNPDLGNLLTGANQFYSRVNYTRQEVKGTFSQFFDLGSTQHQLKIGGGYSFGEEDFFRLTNGWGQISRITVAGAPVYRARYYFTQPPQLGQGRTLSAFIQDTVTINSRLTLNLGLLANQDMYTQELAGSGGCPQANTPTGQPGGAAIFKNNGDRCDFIKFSFGDQIQPRVGVNFNVRADKGDKLYANWGRYSNMDQISSARSLAPRRIFQREARFNATTGALISDLPRQSTSTKQIDPALKPTYNDEILAGYATPLNDTWSLDLFYIYRNTENFMEDLPSDLPDGRFAVGNFPCQQYSACRGIDAIRKYKAATVEVSRRLKDKWSLNASYTWSKFEGNFDLDYASVATFNTSSFIQDGPGTNIQEAGRQGPLRQDRPHVLKVFANYKPLDKLTLGTYVRVQSGTPWNARGQDSQGGSALYYLEPAGTNRNPTWTNIDLQAAYALPVGGSKASVTLEARVLNVLDNQEVTSTDSVKFTNFVGTTTAPFIAPGTILNPTFGRPNGYAAPRRILLSALVSF